MTHQEITDKLSTAFGEDIIEAVVSYDMLTVIVAADKNLEVLLFLRDDTDLNFHFLTDLCGIHYPFNADNELGVVYHLHSMVANIRIRVKAFFPSKDPVIRSATGLWASAGWMERETFDFYGILFENHPDLRRILNVDDMDYHPMLKQYPLEDGTRDDKNDAMFGR